MAENPEGFRYTKEHEWIDPKTGKVGITDYAQHSLTDIVFVELPEKGKKTEQGKSFAIVESVKSVSDVFAPASGVVEDNNPQLSEKPQLVNEEPFGKGWIAKLKIANSAELTKLLDKKAYESYLKTQKH